MVVGGGGETPLYQDPTQGSQGTMVVLGGAVSNERGTPVCFRSCTTCRVRMLLPWVLIKDSLSRDAYRGYMF